MKPMAIIQARIGSTRLPGKVLKALGQGTMLSYVVRRCQLSRRLQGVVLATTEESADDALVDAAKALGIEVFRGSQVDVLDRYVRAATLCGADPILRITSDCPLIAPELIDQVVDEYSQTQSDYISFAGYPRGIADVDLVTFAALQRAIELTTPEDTYYREHVITYHLDHPDQFKFRMIQAPESAQRVAYRLCVDEPADLEVIRRICSHFAPRIDFTLSEILAFLEQHPDIAAINSHVKQKTG